MLDLNKGSMLDLTKIVEEEFQIAISWDASTTGGDVDLDVSAFLLAEDNGLKKIRGGSDVVFFNNKVHASGSVSLSGDSKDGRGDGDDEFITIVTKNIPADIVQVNVYSNIFTPPISFKDVKNAKAEIRTKAGKVLATFKLTDNFQTENTILIGTVSKVNGNWTFTAEGEGYVTQDLNTIYAHLASGI